MSARGALLAAAAAGPISADTAEDGVAALATASGEREPALRAALAALLAEQLIRDPVRLEPGALHCRWVLELTHSGRDAARRLTGD